MSRFSLRECFWLTLVVGLAVGWWSNRSQLFSDYDRLKDQMRAEAERSRVAAHTWWMDAIQDLSAVDRLTLLARLATEQAKPDYELLTK